MLQAGGNDYSLFRHLCDGILLRHDPNDTRVLVVIAHSMYLDDAGHPSDKPLLCVGGFIATQTRWMDFADEWRKCLVRNKIEAPFHATDFFSQRSKDKRLPYIVDDMVRVIANHVLAAFSATVDITAYKACNDFYRLEEVCGAPLAMCTRSVYDNFSDWKKIVGFSDPTLFFIEEGSMHYGDMVECLKNRDGFSPPVPVRKNLEPCQAADLYVYGMYQHYRDQAKYRLQLDFDEKLAFPRERRDTFMGREHLLEYATRPSIGFLTSDGKPFKASIPTRRITQNADFKFPKTPKVKRIRRIKEAK